MRHFKCVTTTKVLVFWSACLSCLPDFNDDSGHKGNGEIQGKS